MPNNTIKYAKRKYFNDNLTTNKKDPHKTWQLINELNSCQPKNKVIADIEIGSCKISSASEMADASVISQMLDITWQEAYLVFILNRNTILSQLTRPVLF